MACKDYKCHLGWIPKLNQPEKCTLFGNGKCREDECCVYDIAFPDCNKNSNILTDIKINYGGEQILYGEKHSINQAYGSETVYTQRIIIPKQIHVLGEFSVFTNNNSRFVINASFSDYFYRSKLLDVIPNTWTNISFTQLFPMITQHSIKYINNTSSCQVVLFLGGWNKNGKSDTKPFQIKFNTINVSSTDLNKLKNTAVLFDISSNYNTYSSIIGVH